MEVVKANLFDHPALIAWRKIKTDKLEPKGIEILQEKKRKAAVYRLCGAGPNEVSIIAKLCRRIEANRERVIYEKVLPRLPIHRLRFYGFLNEDNLDWAWLFLEDVGKEHLSVLSKGHYSLAARWLALMHTSATNLTETACLRNIGLDYYFECLKKIQSTVMLNLSNPAFTSDDIAVLKDVLLHCENFESNWSLLDSLCKQVPQTLVHCSFRKDNMRIFSSSRGDSLMVFDWGAAGWGALARDIAKLREPSLGEDISVYFSSIRDQWTISNVKVIQKLWYVGQILRCFEHMTWAVVNLCYDWVVRPMKKMKKHKNRLDKYSKALWGTCLLSNVTFLLWASL